jgi:hypothetical protein
MKQARSFGEFEDAWRDYLGALGRVWSKVERACQHIRNQFEPWQQPTTNERRTDPLLRYLHHARNADTHTIQEIVLFAPGSMTIQPTRPGGWFIERMVIRDGQLVEYSGDQPIRQEITPPRIQLLPVTDRGVIYQTPTEHCGSPLPSTNPVTVAAIGLTYYAGYVAKVGRTFFGSAPPAE